MARPDFEKRPSPENANVRIADPAELMHENPAALIVNKESYALMQDNFSPDRFDPPQVVRVKTYSSEQGEVIRLFVLDGLTRTKYVNDHKAEILSKHPHFKFTVRDVTDSVLKTSRITPKEERIEGQKDLTMLQYLRAVVPPTVEHSEIVADRIAAHLINGWDNMVGEGLSGKFSALAAISLLENPRVSTATEEMLRKYLGQQKKLIANETIDERTKLQEKLLEMSSIIRQTKSYKGEISRAAFLLVGQDSIVIGGEKEAKRQIYGLLHTPDVDQKLAEAYPEEGIREQMRDQLGKFMVDTFKKFLHSPNKEQIFGVLGESLRDADLKFNHVLDVFTSPQPVERYTEVRREINKDKLANTYLSGQKKKELTETESLLIDQLGSKTFLDRAELQSLVQGIKSADSLVEQTSELKARLIEQREELLKNGVAAQTIDNAISALDSTQGGVFVSNTLNSLSTKARDLRETIAKVSRKVAFEQNVYKVAGVVNSFFPKEQESEYGPYKIDRINTYILQEFGIYHKTGVLDIDTVKQIKVKLRQLTDLDADIQSAVLSGNIRMEFAVKKQRERKLTVITPPSIQPKEETVIPKIEAKPEQRVATPPSQRIEQPLQNGEEVVLDKESVEKRRRLSNNEKFERAVRYLLGELTALDLDQDEFTEASRRTGEELIRKLGERLLGHPDIIRLAKEKMLEQKQQIRKLETKIEEEIEEAQKKTRTKKH